MFSAILRRELLTPLRRRRMVLFQIGLATLFGLLVILRWPTDGEVAFYGARSREILSTIRLRTVDDAAVLVAGLSGHEHRQRKTTRYIGVAAQYPIRAGSHFHWKADCRDGDGWNDPGDEPASRRHLLLHGWPFALRGHLEGL